MPENIGHPILFLLLISFVFLNLSMPGLALPICIEGDERPCGTNVGACEFGNSTCTNGEWSPCIGGVKPILEVCSNNLDDNCNGLVDECITSIWIILAIIGAMILGFIWILAKV